MPVSTSLPRWIFGPLAGLILTAVGAEPAAAPFAPTSVVWAWKRAEHLPFLRPGRDEVAWFAAELRIDGPMLRMHRRRNPLTVPDGVKRMLVAHIDVGRQIAPVFSEVLRDALVEALAAVAAIDPAATLQVDFEPRRSERAFYGEVLVRLREKLPQRRISITALSSWCWGDRWLSGLPVDEVVPMLFRMGLDGIQIREDLAAGRWPPEPLCRQAAGVALDELPSGLPPFARVYWFAPRSWRIGYWEKAGDALKRWGAVDSNGTKEVLEDK